MSVDPGSATRVVLRPLGNPLPLGFAGLAAATLLVSGLQLSWFSPTEGHEVALILIAFVFPVQLLASIFGYLARDVVAGTGMGILAVTWLSVGLIKLTGAPGSLSDPLGLLLLVAAAAMVIPAIGALGGKGVATVVLFTTALRFASTGVYELSGSEGWGDAAGVVGLVLCALALAAALAMLLKDARGDAAAEPGVRPQL